MIHPERIQSETFVESVEWLREISSTNTHALKNIQRYTDYPVLIGADLQTQGRGRNRNQWWGAEGSLTFSLVVSPATFGIQRESWPLLSLLVGLSVGTALRPVCNNSMLHLKWPNDVYMNQRKICGILIESVPAHPELLILGIGVNVNNSLNEAPTEVRNRATSVYDLTGSSTSIEDLLIDLLDSLNHHFAEFHDSKSAMMEKWREHCYLTGRQICVDNAQSTAVGTCQGIDDDGSLRMMTVNGLQNFVAGTITLLDE